MYNSRFCTGDITCSISVGILLQSQADEGINFMKSEVPPPLVITNLALKSLLPPRRKRRRKQDMESLPWNETLCGNVFVTAFESFDGILTDNSRIKPSSSAPS
jgi:hypothetical protein